MEVMFNPTSYKRRHAVSYGRKRGINTQSSPLHYSYTPPGSVSFQFVFDGTGAAFFGAVVCGDDVDETKPHPMPYLTTASLLGADIRRCVAIEDSPNGVASASAAGAVVLAVPCEVDLSHLTGVVHVDSLLAVDVDFLDRLVNHS